MYVSNIRLQAFKTFIVIFVNSLDALALERQQLNEFLERTE